MKHPRLALIQAAALIAPLAWIGTIPKLALAAPIPPPLIEPTLGPLPSAEASSGPDWNEQVPLGRAYESPSAGISFAPPADCKLTGEISSKYLAEWSNAERDWTLKLGKMVLDRPSSLVSIAPLVTTKDNFNKDAEGILDRTIRNLKSSLPGCKILRQDVTNTREGGRFDTHHPEWRNNVGLIAIRYTSGGQHRLSQQAIIQSPDGVYYLLTLTTPGSKSNDDAVEDPAERQAAETFSRMIDSVRLLDRSAIKRDQDIRLYNTRAAFVNWTASRMANVMISEQWVRILRDGKDIGYTYVTEDRAGGIPRPLNQKEMSRGQNERDLIKPGEGVLIGVRARIITEGTRADKTKGPVQTDSASWFYVSADKKHEDFSRVVVTDDRKSAKKGYIQEFGVSEKRVRRYFEKPAADPNSGIASGGVVDADRAPVPVFKEDWELDVSATSATGMADPLTRKLPPWYIPQALTHLVPRLLPLQKPQSYLFATYVSEAREVVMRYVDVLPEDHVTFNGQAVRAVPIHDRLGLEGPLTVHYMTIDGVYLGSENKEQKTVMLPTDSETLLHIWTDANLTRPGGVDRPGPTNAGARRPDPNPARRDKLD